MLAMAGRAYLAITDPILETRQEGASGA
jgi:hypothetical protein